MAKKIIISEELKQELINKYVNLNLTVNDIIRSGIFPGSKEALKRRLEEWGVYRYRVLNCKTEVFENEILPAWLAGESLCSLEKRFKTNKSTISKKLKELGYDIINPQLELQFNENIFDSINTEEKAYWLGFIYADGNIKTIHNPERKTEYCFTITLKESDKDHLFKFNKFMEHKKDNRHYHKSKNPCCSWYVCNKHLWETLNNYGCIPNKSLILKFPDKSIFKDESLIRHFIRGYFDGDGCFSQEKLKFGIYPRLSLLGTIDIVENISNYSKCGGHVFEETRSKNIYYILRFNREESLKFMDYIYKDSTIYLDRKYAKYNLFKDNPLLSYEEYEQNIDIFNNYS